MASLDEVTLAALEKFRNRGYKIETWTEKGVIDAGLKMTAFVATVKGLTKLDAKSLDEILGKANSDRRWFRAAQCTDTLFAEFLDWLNKDEGKAFLHKVERKRFVEKKAGFELCLADAACLCAFNEQLVELDDRVNMYLSADNKHLGMRQVNALKGSLQPAGGYVKMGEADLGKACMALQMQKDPNTASTDAVLAASMKTFKKQAIANNKIQSLNSTDRKLLKKWVEEKIDLFSKKEYDHTKLKEYTAYAEGLGATVDPEVLQLLEKGSLSKKKRKRSISESGSKKKVPVAQEQGQGSGVLQLE